MIEEIIEPEKFTSNNNFVMKKSMQKTRSKGDFTSYIIDRNTSKSICAASHSSLEYTHTMRTVDKKIANIPKDFQCSVEWFVK